MFNLARGRTAEAKPKFGARRCAPRPRRDASSLGVGWVVCRGAALLAGDLAWPPLAIVARNCR